MSSESRSLEACRSRSDASVEALMVVEDLLKARPEVISRTVTDSGVVLKRLSYLDGTTISSGSGRLLAALLEGLL